MEEMDVEAQDYTPYGELQDHTDMLHIRALQDPPAGACREIRVQQVHLV